MKALFPAARHFPMQGISVLLALLVLAGVLPRAAVGQCGPTVVGRYGGEISAVARVNASTLLVARGTELELFSLANPAAPAPFSPPRRVGLEAPAVKIAMAEGSSRAYVLLRDGSVKAISMFYSPFVGMNGLMNTPTSDAVDILAAGDLVYVAEQSESFDGDDLYSQISVYNTANGVPAHVRSIRPLADGYGFDRLARVGNILWAGFHEHESTILGVDGFDISNPAAAAPRVGAALANIPFGAYTHISAMTAIGNRLLVSYLHDDGPDNDWLRAVDVSLPTNPVWQNPVNLNGTAGTMSSAGNLLRISIKNSGIGTWDTTNQAALTWRGAYFDADPNIGQMVSGGGTDYWAAGWVGLMTVNTADPSEPWLQSTPIVPLPTAPRVVRQRGNTTVVLDYTLNALRLYDYTLPEGQQHRASVQLEWNSEMVELGELAGPVYLACVATYLRPGGDVIQIIDITNPAAPVVRSTIPMFRPQLLSVSGSRMYVINGQSDFVIIELAQPLSPQVRSVTPFGGNSYDYTCMTSWSNNAVALGTARFGLWTINTTNATAPLVSDIWNPETGYAVKSLAKGPTWLFVSATVDSDYDSRLETLNVSNLANVSLRFLHNSIRGAGVQPAFENLTYVASPTGKFLIGTNSYIGFEPAEAVDNTMHIYELPTGGFAQEAVPFPIGYERVPFAFDKVAVNGDGSRIMAAGRQAGLYQFAPPAQWAPAFATRLTSDRVCHGDTTAFLGTLPSGSPATITYQWYRGNTPLVDGPTPWGSTITGATDWFLTITNPRPQDAMSGPFSYHSYSLVATNSCGSTRSSYTTITVCPADFNCDNAVDPDDLSDFITCFFLDVGSPGDCPNADFNADGFRDPDDLSDFITAFFTSSC